MFHQRYTFLTFSRRDIRFLKPLYYFGSFLGLTPYYNFEKHSLENLIQQKIKGTLLSILIITGSLYSLVERQHVLRNLNLYLDFVNDIVNWIVPVTAIINASFFNRNKWLLLNNSFQQIDKTLNNRKQQESNFLKNPFFQCAINVLTVFIILAYVLWSWCYHFGVDAVLRTYLIHNFCYNSNTIVFALITNYALAFRCRYQDLNHCLTSDSLMTKYKNGSSLVTVFRQVGTLSRTLSEMVTLFNEIFGWTFVYMAAKTIAHILATSMRFLEKDNEVTNMDIRLSNFLAISLSIANFTVVMMCGSSVATESSKTAFLCYKLQEHFPPKSDERLEILILAKQVQANDVKITAADFFEINRSTLCGILATCTTYVIVVLQFSGNF
ncbi:hypothetical protein Zmor_010026 [Zophobas morio]|uniref:Gustatory receptor n=1 Tax=Zophobas morio TaxID=2755281 RepID=A0AA38IN40_9CUCU|nr:hypothetical protein Zmor_010026 [Zophobas morio]